jgi:hypothetical protein
MCACRCGIKVTLDEGRVRFIQGNPDHPVNQGVTCAKPLLSKPGSERGSDEFVPIGWGRRAFAFDATTAAHSLERAVRESGLLQGHGSARAAPI